MGRVDKDRIDKMGRVSNSFLTKGYSIVCTKGAFNNYVDKMRGEGVKKCQFLSTLRV